MFVLLARFHQMCVRQKENVVVVREMLLPYSCFIELLYSAHSQCGVRAAEFENLISDRPDRLIMLLTTAIGLTEI